MRGGDRVYVRIGGTDDRPEFRPGLLLRDRTSSSDPAQTWSVRVFLDHLDDDFPDVTPAEASEGTVRWFCRRGTKVREFWTEADMGVPSWRT